MIDPEIVVAGGGLAGLTGAIALARAGCKVLVIEKKIYPFHRVCGEYISNEVVPYLHSLGVHPYQLNPSKINKLLVSSPKGRIIELDLALGGFGISRYRLDYFLYQKAKEEGVQFLLGTTISSVKFRDDHFFISTSSGDQIIVPLVIGSFGKRSNLDKEFNRSFFYQRSPYIAVKYHIKYNHPENLIALHNFRDGYGGISRIEDDSYCFCYLTTRKNLRSYGNVKEMEKKVLSRNPFLDHIFHNAEFLFDKPKVINEICFEQKSLVENHILMTGDSAGMIAPLCGNGMAMAIHSSKILAAVIIRHLRSRRLDRANLEKEYCQEWTKMFKIRLVVGRNIQRLFGNEYLTDATIGFLNSAKPLANWLIRQTHGTPF